MRRQARTVVVLLLTVLAVASAQTQFNMGGVGATNFGTESYLPQAESMGSNWQEINCIGLSPSQVAVLLNEANTRGIRVFLNQAGLGNGRPDITTIASGQYTYYWAESLCGSSDIGHLSPDPRAQGQQAWLVTSADPADTFQTKFKDDVFANADLRAYFRLRADTGAADETTSVCRLQVARPNGGSDTVDAETTLRARDFPSADSYHAFELSFNRNGGSSQYKLRILWYSRIDSLWSDYAELCDMMGDSLMRQLPDGSPPPYAALAESIGQYYNPYSAVYRYYLADEARPCQFACSGEVNRILRGLTQPGDTQKLGINWMNWWSGDQNRYQKYVAAVQPNEFWCDMYPLMGRTWPSQGPNPPPPESGGSRRTPVDSGFVFQTQLDSYCLVLDTARVVAARHGIPLWVDAQAYGEVITDSVYDYEPEWDTITEPPATPDSDESVWRLPSSREFSCISWLPLAYGAKGLDYWTWTYRGPWPPQHPLKYYYVLGVLKWDVADSRPSHAGTHMFGLVQTFFDSTLKKIAPTLLNLHSVDVGQWNGAAIDFIAGCTDTLLHFGTFYDETHTSDKYFIAVNRHCLPTDFVTPSVTLDLGPSPAGSYYLLDEVSGEAIAPASGPLSGPFRYSVHLSPGEGRLFRIVPFAGSVAAIRDRPSAI